MMQAHSISFSYVHCSFALSNCVKRRGTRYFFSSTFFLDTFAAQSKDLPKNYFYNNFSCDIDKNGYKKGHMHYRFKKKLTISIVFEWYMRSIGLEWEEKWGEIPHGNQAPIVKLYCFSFLIEDDIFACRDVGCATWRVSSYTVSCPS